MQNPTHLQPTLQKSMETNPNKGYVSNPPIDPYKRTLEVAYYPTRPISDSQIRLFRFFTSVAPDTIGASLPMFFEILRDWEQNPELNGISADKVGNLVFEPLQKAIPWLAFHMGDVFEVGMLYLATQYLFGIVIASSLGEKLNPKLKKFISQKRRLLGAILSTIPIATFEITHSDTPDALGAIGAALVILGLSKIVKTGVQKWLDNANIDTKQKRVLKSML